jgi:hypothetical protein
VIRNLCTNEKLFEDLFGFRREFNERTLTLPEGVNVEKLTAEYLNATAEFR